MSRKNTGIAAAILMLLLIYLASGIYSLENGQHGIVLRFGRIVDSVSTSGIHYRFPFPIEKTLKLHLSKVQRMAVYDEKAISQDRITGDENLAVVQAMISFDIKQPADYLFNISNVESLLKTTSQYCMSRELANITVEDAMTSGKTILQVTLKQNVQKILDRLHTGVRIITFELTDISPPSGVSAAFIAVSGARVKKQEIIKNAEGYANAKLPAARGEIVSILTKAEASARETVTLANGRVSAFNKLAKEYHRNPSIIANQKYLETIRTIAAKATISLDTNPLQTIFYLNGKMGVALPNSKEEKSAD